MLYISLKQIFSIGLFLEKYSVFWLFQGFCIYSQLFLLQYSLMLCIINIYCLLGGEFFEGFKASL